MAQPQPITLDDFVTAHAEEFVRYELWVSEGLTKHLVNEFNLDTSFTAVVVELDAENPVADVVDDTARLRLNGRFFYPLEDKNGVDLEVSTEEWIESCQNWFDENSLKVIFDEESKEVLKFTTFLPAIEVPPPTEGETETGDEAPSEGEEESAEEDLGSDDESFTEEEFTEETDDESPPDASENPEDDLADFEEALGL